MAPDRVPFWSHTPSAQTNALTLKICAAPPKSLPERWQIYSARLHCNTHPLWRPPMSAEDTLRDAALDYHRSPRHGKVSVTPTKPLSNQRDLSLAYSPGVAYPCLAIE